VDCLNVEAFIMGGGVSRSWDLLHPVIRAEVNRRAYTYLARRTKILKARHCGHGPADNGKKLTRPLPVSLPGNGLQNRQ
jgi:hypothetical protein